VLPDRDIAIALDQVALDLDLVVAPIGLEKAGAGVEIESPDRLYILVRGLGPKLIEQIVQLVLALVLDDEVTVIVRDEVVPLIARDQPTADNHAAVARANHLQRLEHRFDADVEETGYADERRVEFVELLFED